MNSCHALLVGRAAAVAAILAIGTPALAQSPAPPQNVTPSGMRVSPELMQRAVDDSLDQLRIVRAEDPRPVLPVPTFKGDKPVVALASAIGGQLSMVFQKTQTGSNMEPFERDTLPMPDHTLDAIVLRGLDRVVTRSSPDSERVFMRLNPVLLEDIAPQDREKVALARLVEEMRGWPQRQQWDRIIVVTPHYRGFERAGLGSKLHGIGLYIPNQNNTAEYDVIEPDGTPGVRRRSTYVALYYYAMLVVLDAKSLRVLDSQPWLIDEKIHDSKSESLNIAKSIPPDLLAERIEVFAEKASNVALTRTLNGLVVPGDLREVKPGTP